MTRSGESALKMTTLVKIKKARVKLIPVQIERMVEPLACTWLSPCDVVCPPLGVYAGNLPLQASGEGVREEFSPP